MFNSSQAIFFVFCSWKSLVKAVFRVGVLFVCVLCVCVFFVLFYFFEDGHSKTVKVQQDLELQHGFVCHMLL